MKATPYSCKCDPLLLQMWHMQQYGVASISRLLQITRLFWKRALQNRRYSAEETWSFEEPTNCSHPIEWRSTLEWFTLVNQLLHMCHICDMTHPYMRHESWIFFFGFRRKCSCVSHDSSMYICVHVCFMTHVFMCVSWLIHIYMSSINICDLNPGSCLFSKELLVCTLALWRDGHVRCSCVVRYMMQSFMTITLAKNSQRRTW